MNSSISFTIQGESEISSFAKAAGIERYFRWQPTSRIMRPIYVVDGKAYPFSGLEVKSKAMFADEFPDGKFNVSADVAGVVLISKGRRITITDSAPRVETRKSGRLVYYCKGNAETFSILSVL